MRLRGDLRLSLKYKKTALFLFLLLVGLGLTLWGCGSGGPSSSSYSSSGAPPPSLRILATDAPFAYSNVVSAMVDVQGIELREVGAEGFTPLEGFVPKPLDLVKLQNGITDLLYEGDPPQGVYDALRIIVVPVEIVVKEGEGEAVKTLTITGFKVPSAEQTGIKVYIEPNIAVVSHLTTDLILDFDLSRSFVAQGNSKSIAAIKSFHFKPVVRAVNVSTAGTLTFRVASDMETPEDLSDDEFMNGVVYDLYDDSVDPPQLFASGISNTIPGGDPADPADQGYVKHPAITAGIYRLELSLTGYADKTVDPVEIIIANLTDLGIIILADNDYDDDGWSVDVDCDDNDEFWNIFDPTKQYCDLKAYSGCERSSQYDDQCLPNVSNVEAMLNGLNENTTGIDVDKFTWSGALTRPAWPKPKSVIAKKHNQSIQYLEHSFDLQLPANAGTVPVFQQFIVTTMSDETSEDEAAITVVQSSTFASEDGDIDWIVAQTLLESTTTTARFNHAGGAQLIGEYLFVALEDMDGFTTPLTGVWQIDRDQGPAIKYKYSIEIADETGDDYHHSAVGVTKLFDGTYLVAACVKEDCDIINFYKSKETYLDLESLPETDPPVPAKFKFVDQWYRHDYQPNGTDSWSTENWASCPPQNLNLAAQSDGDIYLVLFGVHKNFGDTCGMGNGNSNLFAYKVDIHKNFEVTLEFRKKVPVIPSSPSCGSLELSTPNFDAGGGLWFSPLGADKISYLAIEHYDTCGSAIYNGKTRWGVSNNWRP